MRRGPAAVAAATADRNEVQPDVPMPKLAKDASLRILGGKVSRSVIVKLALLRRFGALAREYK
jgi:hypothetical protein